MAAEAPAAVLNRGLGIASEPLGPDPFSALLSRQPTSFLSAMTTTTTFKGVDPNSRNSSR